MGAQGSAYYNPNAPITPDPLVYSFEAGWSPDSPDFENPGAPTATNVVPRTPTSFGPVPSMSKLPFGSLGAQCIGSAAYLDNNGNVFIFAGDVSDLYVLTTALSTFTNVSQSAGMYHGTIGQAWNFEYFNGVVIATNGVDNPQAYTIGTSTTFNDLALSICPRGKYVATIKNFLVFADTSDNIVAGPLFYYLAPTYFAKTYFPLKYFDVYSSTYEVNHQRIWWSPLNNPFDPWPQPGSVAAITVQSSYNDIFGPQGWCQGLVGNLGNADGAVFFEHAVYRMIYAGPPDFFDLLPAQGVKGCPAPQSIVHLGAAAYYLGEDGFYGFDGMNAQPIGANLVDKWFYANVNPTFLNQTIGAVDPLNKLIYWAFCTLGAQQPLPDAILVFNWQLNAWSLIEVEVEYLVRMLTLGYTLDQLWTILHYFIDSLPYPLWSKVWTKGSLTLGAFDTTHTLNVFNGPNMVATVDTPEKQPFEGQRGFLTGARPLIDGGLPSIAIGKRDRMVDPVTYGKPVKINSIGTCPQYTTGRYLRAQITTRLGDSWTNIIGVELEGEPVGNQ